MVDTICVRFRLLVWVKEYTVNTELLAELIPEQMIRLC